jgi:UDP-glucose 4-epimerase
MRIVVTGASGNVGSQVLSRLAGHDLVGIARRPPASGPLAEAASWVSLDLSAPGSVPELARVLRGADAVVHLAWLIAPGHAPDVLTATNIGGTRHLLRAVAEAEVPALVYASSVGAYSPGPKDRLVDESWPTEGIPSSLYSRHKARVERMLDGFSRDRPGVRIVRLRPGIVTQAAAASEQARYFIGPFLPMPLLRRSLIPVVPALAGLRFQLVHAEDVGRAFATAVTSDVRGAVNLAAEPVLDPKVLGRLLRARPVPVPRAAARALVEVTFRLRLQPTEVGWLDMALAAPLMDTGRARRELGWTPTHDAGDTLLEALAGVAAGAGGPSPVLRAVRGPLDQLRGGVRSLRPGSGGRI